jgi:hypothetical protein
VPFFWGVLKIVSKLIAQTIKTDKNAKPSPLFEKINT